MRRRSLMLTTREGDSFAIWVKGRKKLANRHRKRNLPLPR
jgi:hypothetical protein